MSATYTVVTLDGQEHAGLDLETLKKWYCARRLRADSFVLSSELGQWKLLKNLFDTSQWQAEQRAAGGSWMNDAAHETVPSSQTYYQPSAQTSYPTPSQEDGANERNLGVRTAAIFLFVNAALNLISLAYIGVQHTSADHSSSPSWGLSIIFDVIVGAKLLRSDNVKRWRRYALGRACLGGLIFGTLFITMGRTDAARAIGLMQFVFAASFVLLLMGNSPSRARVAAGALAFVISLSGILGIYFVGDMTGDVTEKQEILKYALPTRSFNDALSGASVDLPNGWVMLPPINPITNIPEAHMIAAHPESGSFAALESSPPARLERGTVRNRRWRASCSCVAVIGLTVVSNRSRRIRHRSTGGKPSCPPIPFHPRIHRSTWPARPLATLRKAAFLAVLCATRFPSTRTPPGSRKPTAPTPWHACSPTTRAGRNG